MNPKQAQLDEFTREKRRQELESFVISFDCAVSLSYRKFKLDPE